MTQNLITSAFELVRDVEHGVLLLDTFHRLAAREVRLLAASSSPALCFPPAPSTRPPASAHALSKLPVSLIVPLVPQCLDGLGAGRGATCPRRVVSVLSSVRLSSGHTTRRRWISTCCSMASWPS